MCKEIIAAIMLAANVQAVAAPSQTSNLNCAPLPLELAAWAAADVTIRPDMKILLGKPVIVPLQPTTNIRFSKPPERVPDAKSFSNSVHVSLKDSGIYRLVTDKPIWLDVVAPAGIQSSRSHQHGPACSNIRKIVEYQLASGSHIIQISGGKTSSAKIMIIRVR